MKKRLVAIFLFLSFDIFAQTPWLAFLNFQTPNSSISLSFGGSSSATAGFDNGLDILAPPPPPSSGYRGYFLISAPLFNQLSRDIRQWFSPNPTSTDWTIVVENANGIQTTLTWNANELAPEGAFTLVIGSNSFNMRSEATATFTDNQTLTIQYRYSTLDAPNYLSLQIVNNHNLKLSFSQVIDANAYHIYRSTTANFIPDRTNGTNRIGTNVTDQDLSTPGVQWVDPNNVVGDPSINYFYAVTSVAGGESAPSSHFGEFDFSLVMTPTTDFNEIALPLVLSGVTNAEELMNVIPGCNSVARWNANLQGYEQYVPGLSFTNFNVQMGYPYYVNATTDAVFTLLGGLSDPTFDLVETPTTDFNDIMLPLDKTHITKASGLMSDIPNCNSVARWNAALQGYEQYVPGLSFTDFDVRVGYPYYVNVTADVTWPGGGTAKRARVESEIAQGEEGSKAPHVVWGRIHADGDSLDERDVRLTAYILNRPDEKLTEDSPGCMINEGHWIVQCGSFPSRWKAGEILRVEVGGKNGKAEVEVELTYNPSDESEEIVLEQTRLIPTSYGLSQNYPNPFNPETTIAYQLPETGHVTIVIYNMMGQEVRKLIDEDRQAGFHEVVWDGRNEKGETVPSGIFIIRTVIGEVVKTRKVLLMK